MNNQTLNLLLIGVLCGMVTGAIISIKTSNRYYRKILIEHKVAYYDILTGKFTIVDKTNNFYFIKVNEKCKLGHGGSN